MATRIRLDVCDISTDISKNVGDGAHLALPDRQNRTDANSS